VQEILAVQPDYIDCYLRLACVARAKGAIATALDWAKQALSRQGGHSDALALMSQLHMERREYPQAENYIRQLLKASAPGGGPDGKGSSHGRDSYGQLAMGNLLLVGGVRGGG
jgi:RNA polymerase-associated protein CTR9